MNDHEGDLLRRARSWAGHVVVDVAPAPAAGHKGGVGQRLEQALGLKPRFDDVDDPVSGIEVKTLPFAMGTRGQARVLESTFVTTASASTLVRETWATSRVKKKLARVLFVPVERSTSRIGAAFLYEPDDDDEAILRADWEDLSDFVAAGLGFAISARRGRVLQLRPKAKNAQTTTTVTTTSTATCGEEIEIRPQGFYLRPKFTQQLIDQRFT
ncbi:MAG: MutH/Sau3AI family endonuclease [Deltaproteobacteria bacterium]|nr:MutH/Sau3AI family endonuclease [Deltaproteobacteria bacterium]